MMEDLFELELKLETPELKNCLSICLDSAMISRWEIVLLGIV